jgi:hypothetical protein
MQCQKCGYQLWNIRSRQCPECGRDFKPSDFVFVPGAVVFCCPHCDQNYFGTDTKGHLEPDAFVCTSCDNPIKMDEMILRPADGWEKLDTTGCDNPWIDRKPGDNRFKAWFKTVGRAIFRPSSLVAPRMTPQQDRAALAFFVINLLIQLLGVLSRLFFKQLSFPWNRDLSSGNGTVLLRMTGYVVLAFVLVFVLTMAWGVLTHFLLRIKGKPHGTTLTTCATLGLAHAVTLPIAIPLIGLGWGVVLLLWWVVAATFMITRRHQVSHNKASWVVNGALAILFILGTFASVSSIVFVRQWMGLNPSMGDTRQVGRRIMVQVNDDGTIGPNHILQMAVERKNGDWMKALADLEKPNEVSTESFQEGGNDLMLWCSYFQEQVDYITQSLAQLPPQDGPGYRFGSMLFLYNKVKADQLNPDLWLVVYWPRHSTPKQYAVFKADRRQIKLTRQEILDGLASQNQLRKTMNLPLISAWDDVKIRPMVLDRNFLTERYPLDRLDLVRHLLDYQREDGLIGPNHISMLIVQQKMANIFFQDDGCFGNGNKPAQLFPKNWISPWSSQFSGEMRQRFNKLIESLPPRSGAGYRFGTMLLLYDGIKREQLKPELWLAVRWPLDVTPQQTRIFKADGHVVQVLTEDMPQMLAEQDALREELDLPLIGDLSKIKPIDLDFSFVVNEKEPMSTQ